MPFAPEHFCVVDGVPTADLCYVPNALPEAEESRFLANLYGPAMAAAGKMKAAAGLPTRCGKWQQLRRRRLVMLGGDPDPKGTFAVPVPSWGIDPFEAAMTAACGGEQPHDPDNSSSPSEPSSSTALPVLNHVLINEYEGGAGIMPHEDGPLYHPVVSIFSLETPLAIRFRRRRGAEEEVTEADELTVVLEPRSLFVFRGRFYTDYLHRIDEAAADDVALDDGTCANRHLISDELVRRCTVVDGDGVPGAKLCIPRGERRISVTLRLVPNIRGWRKLRPQHQLSPAAAAAATTAPTA
jgi:alkylated DNA repair protein alkB family protein 6